MKKDPFGDGESYPRARETVQRENPVATPREPTTRRSTGRLPSGTVRTGRGGPDRLADAVTALLGWVDRHGPYLTHRLPPAFLDGLRQHTDLLSEALRDTGRPSRPPVLDGDAISPGKGRDAPPEEKSALGASQAPTRPGTKKTPQPKPGGLFPNRSG